MPIEISFGRSYAMLAAPLGLGPKQTDVRVDDDTLHVKMGWAFRADIPLASITNATRKNDWVASKGVHGWRGRWLVNGSSKGLVELTIDPSVQARVTGVPIKLHTLLLSVTDPDALIVEVRPHV